MTWGARLAAAVWGAVGVGWVVGGLEVTALAVRLPVPFQPIDLLIAGVAAIGATGLLGALVALVLSPLLLALRARPAEVAVAAIVALATTALAGMHIWRVSWLLWTEARSAAAFTLAVLPIGLGGIVYYNAVYWIRRIEAGRSGRGIWPALALAAGCGAVLLGIAVALLRTTEGTRHDGNDAILVTVDGLRRDAVGVYGGNPTPFLDQLARESITFVDAVSPTPLSGPANAAALSGLHPLRNRRISDDRSLMRAVKTLPEALAEQGWSTTAFVGSAVVSADTGMAQGFGTFDDRFVPPWARIALLAPFADPAASRPARDTTEAFLAWLDAHPSRPYFAWIHFADPAIAAAAAGDVDAAVVQVDASIQQIREYLEHADRWKHTALVVAGTHGWMNGEHGLRGAVGLYDPVVRIPLIVRVPGYEPRFPRPEPQVRLMDVPATVLELLALEPVLESEGVPLLGYGTGRRKATMSCPLVGPTGDGKLQLGLRNNGVKFLEDPAGGAPQLYVLAKDPGEQDNLAAREPTIVQAAHGMLGPELAALAEQAR
jgi:hypothetical protein